MTCNTLSIDEREWSPDRERNQSGVQGPQGVCYDTLLVTFLRPPTWAQIAIGCFKLLEVYIYLSMSLPAVLASRRPV